MTSITEKVPVVQDKTTGIQCDACGKAYPANADLFYFNSHHQDWGNDSIDSYEYHHACSVDCYTMLLGKCIDALSDNQRTAEIADMPYGFVKMLYERLKQH